MFASFPLSRGLRLAAILAVGLSLAACARGAEDIAGAGGLGAGGAATPGSTQDFTVNVGDRVFFDTDSSDLNASGIATLNQQALWLQRYPRYTFLIEGHADERGTREYNFALGARRAQAVRDYLASRGVSADRMRVVSYGKERPVVACAESPCFAQNRRAVTLLDGAPGS
ncbi:MAG: peptidoglycan-associated lipoprotein Pal [Salinarimonadaceae bacterium]|nr:MAG: peptidoglycan-associated lipoprotein Pal [Salinarimonadaceae bacterium]